MLSVSWAPASHCGPFGDRTEKQGAWLNNNGGALKGDDGRTSYRSVVVMFISLPPSNDGGARESGIVFCALFLLLCYNTCNSTTRAAVYRCYPSVLATESGDILPVVKLAMNSRTASGDEFT